MLIRLRPPALHPPCDSNSTDRASGSAPGCLHAAATSGPASPVRLSPQDELVEAVQERVEHVTREAAPEHEEEDHEDAVGPEALPPGQPAPGQDPFEQRGTVERRDRYQVE